MDAKSMIEGREGRAAVARSEPGGRAERDGSAPPVELAVEGLPSELRDRLGDELIDQLLAGARTEEEIVGPGGVLAQLTRRLVERAMDAELTEHLGIIALYARGMSVRDIQAHLGELYGVEVGRDLISRVTDAVVEDVRAWQQRPLEDVYPVVPWTAWRSRSGRQARAAQGLLSRPRRDPGR